MFRFEKYKKKRKLEEKKIGCVAVVDFVLVYLETL